MTSMIQIQRCKMILQRIITFRFEDPDEMDRQIDLLQDVIWTLYDLEACHKLLDEHQVPNDPHAENELRNRIGWLAVSFKVAQEELQMRYARQQPML